MAAASPAVRGLSTSDLERIRDSLGAGRKPKVLFTEAAGQIAGQQGQVIELTDPQLSDEWLVVRFGRDELPFSPVDLTIPPKAAAARRSAKAADADAGAGADPASIAGPASPAVPAPREERIVTATVPSTVDTPAAEPARATASAKPVNGRPAPSPGPPGPSSGPAEPASAGDPDLVATRAKSAGRKPAKVKPPAALTVTLAYADGDWTVAAQQGSKALARPYLIRAAEALKMVALLDVPGVQAAVEEIVTAARAQAEADAERLRAELTQIEARLAELRDTP